MDLITIIHAGRGPGTEILAAVREISGVISASNRMIAGGFHEFTVTADPAAEAAVRACIDQFRTQRTPR